MAELRANLADMARLNRFGLVSALIKHIQPFLERKDSGEIFRIADLGTGAADIPVAVVRLVRDQGRRISLLAIDIRSDVLACVVPAVLELPEIQRVTADALNPPLREDAVDLAISSLTLHHLSESAVMSLLRVMATVSRLGFVVSDLQRSVPAYAAAWLVTRLSRNRLTRHDGPLSVLRAYTKRELTELSLAAGLPSIRWYRAAAFRVIGVYTRAR